MKGLASIPDIAHVLSHVFDSDLLFHFQSFYWESYFI